MKIIWTFSLVLLAFALTVVMAAPAPAPVPAPADNRQQQVQFVKYTNDQDLAEIQRQIIAQYDHLGGTSQFHEIQGASYVDPQNIEINLK